MVKKKNCKKFSESSQSVLVNLKTHGKLLNYSNYLLNKSGRCIVGALTENKIVKHDTKSTLKNFKNLFGPSTKFIVETS